MTSNHSVVRGAALWFRANPFLEDSAQALVYESDASIWIDDGRVRAIGATREIEPLLPSGIAREHHADGKLIVPGFIDAHVHYAQLPMIGSGGYPLLEWLQNFTFPAEQRFSDYTYACSVAKTFLEQLLRNGTTAAVVFGTVHEASIDAFFDVFSATRMKVFAGKALMDRFVPEGLADTATTGYDQSKRLIDRWHGRGRLGYAITPRFAVTSSPQQLEAAAALWKAHPGTLLQSHLSENLAEVEWVKKVFPDCADYTSVFEKFQLLGRGAIYGHGIHLSQRERQVLAETSTAIAHCPTSNFFLGSGLFDVRAMMSNGPPVRVALATDVGAGTSLSMLKTMAGAYQVAQLRGNTLTPAQLLWLATAGAADALGWSEEVGNLTVGSYADMVVLNPHGTMLTSQRARRAEHLADVLSTIIHCGDDRNIEATYVAGEKVRDRGTSVHSDAA